MCFRRLGHNEQDEPFVTQPLMYKKIAQHPGTRKLYADKLEREGVIARGFADELVTSVRAALDAGKPINPKILYGLRPALAVDWAPYMGVEWRRAADTAVPLARLKQLAVRLTDIPSNFKLHPTVERMLAARREMGLGKLPLDWGMAENLAYAANLDEGHPVRLSGQDSGRGTFAHRHAVLHDQNREKWDSGVYLPLQHIREGQANFLVIDSLLSEEAVLAFEYGYATAHPFELVIWEAQFGDFANGAQVVIDQFIASGEAKWGRLCGLTMFLPHGYEGQGPEHSSARLERYLQLCAEHNIQVVVPSTPAQFFHMIRRQILRPMRKPLIVMTPKSLLRRKESTSALEELATGGFQCVIGDPAGPSPKKVKRVVFCSGKVYFDIAAERDKRGIEDVAVVRIEQLYPFPHAEFAAQIALYCEREERGLGAGGAGQPGRVAPHPALPARAPARRPGPRFGAQEVVRVARRRLPAVAQPAAEGTHRCGPHAGRRCSQEGRGLTPRRHENRGQRNADRSESAAALRKRLRGHAGRLAQEGRGNGQARREPDRRRDRQGGPGASGPGRRGAREDREGATVPRSAPAK